jgi:hypothetical protein
MAFDYGECGAEWASGGGGCLLGGVGAAKDSRCGFEAVGVDEVVGVMVCWNNPKDCKAHRELKYIKNENL